MEFNRSTDGGQREKVIYHRNISITVSRISPVLLLSKSILLSSGCEAIAQIMAATADFKIHDAWWEIYRSPDSLQVSGRTVTELTGVEAYFDADPALRAVGDIDGDLPRELLAECVKGIIQAETYLFQDKGFTSAEVFETTSMNKSYANSCRLYSNMDRVDQTWYEYIADRKSGDALFSLCKTAVIRSIGDGTFIADGGYTDSFQELDIRLTALAGVVVGAYGNFQRAPDSICLENMALLARLNGQTIASLTEQQVEDYCGGPLGCGHIVDIVNHILKTLRDVSV